MKTLYLAIIAFLIFSASQFLNKVQADNDIEIKNIQTVPTAVIIGHTFKINATLVNNSTNPIFVENGVCGAPFSVTFDNHVLVRQNNIGCTLQAIEHKIDPGKEFVASSPNLDLAYMASQAGTANATVTFPYMMQDQNNQSNNKATISKQFFFTIYNRTKVPTLSQSGQQELIDIATSLPGMQAWSHDWRFLSMGYMTAKNQPGVWQYATVNLRAPSNSSKIPCDHDWDAMVTIDMKTMKVISSSYPTMESHNCDNVITGGGPSYGGTPNNWSAIGGPFMVSSPLKQFKSGILPQDIKCNNGLQLVIKSEDGSPVCVKPDTAQKLIQRGWAKEIVANTAIYDAGILPFSSKVYNTNYTVNYNIMGGQISAIKLDSQSKALEISVQALGNGTITIDLPRALIDAKQYQNLDDKFIVLEDGQESSYEETHKTIADRTLSIPFQQGVNKITIIGVHPI